MDRAWGAHVRACFVGWPLIVPRTWLVITVMIGRLSVVVKKTCCVYVCVCVRFVWDVSFGMFCLIDMNMYTYV